MWGSSLDDGQRLRVAHVEETSTETIPRSCSTHSTLFCKNRKRSPDLDLDLHCFPSSKRPRFHLRRHIDHHRPIVPHDHPRAYHVGQGWGCHGPGRNIISICHAWSAECSLARAKRHIASRRAGQIATHRGVRLAVSPPLEPFPVDPTIDLKQLAADPPS